MRKIIRDHGIAYLIIMVSIWSGFVAWLTTVVTIMVKMLA